METNNKNNFQTVKITIKPPNNNSKIARSGDVKLSLSGGENLGLVQSFKVEAQVGSFPTLEINTLITESELEIIQNNTKLNVEIKDNEAYSEGFDSLKNPKNNPYPERSYGYYLFELGIKDALKQDFDSNKSNKIIKEAQKQGKILSLKEAIDMGIL